MAGTSLFDLVKHIGTHIGRRALEGAADAVLEEAEGVLREGEGVLREVGSRVGRVRQKVKTPGRRPPPVPIAVEVIPADEQH
jgi:hypothetical protein